MKNNQKQKKKTTKHLENFSETGVTGKITVNGKSRSSNSKSFRNVSAYIHQDDALRPYLTVREVMTVATHLKLGFNVTKAYKNKMVRISMESTLWTNTYLTFQCQFNGFILFVAD